MKKLTIENLKECKSGIILILNSNYKIIQVIEKEEFNDEDISDNHFCFYRIGSDCIYDINDIVTNKNYLLPINDIENIKDLYIIEQTNINLVQ